MDCHTEPPYIYPLFRHFNVHVIHSDKNQWTRPINSKLTSHNGHPEFDIQRCFMTRATRHSVLVLHKNVHMTHACRRKKHVQVVNDNRTILKPLNKTKQFLKWCIIKLEIGFCFILLECVCMGELISVCLELYHPSIASLLPLNPRKRCVHMIVPEYRWCEPKRTR